MGFIADIFAPKAPAPPPPTPLPPMPTGPSEVDIQKSIATSEKERRKRAAGSSRDETVKTSPLGLSPTAGETNTAPTLLGGY